jgi:hypothetical protein
MGNVFSYAGKIVELKAGSPQVAVQLLREGSWKHKGAPGGVLKVTEDLIDEINENFKSGLKGVELPTNNDHDDRNFKVSKGWIVGMKKVNGKEGVELHGVIEPTPETKKRIEDGEVKFFSPEIQFGWEDPEGGKKHNVMRGGAWTNVPYLKRMKPATLINLSEVLEEEETEEATEDEGGEGREEFNKQKPSLSDAKDSDAQDSGLPDQCRACALLYSGSCPFVNIDSKMAAAGDETCPRYEQMDSGSEDNQAQSEETTMSEDKDKTKIEDQATEITNLHEASKEKDEEIIALSEKVKEADEKFAKLEFDRHRDSDVALLSELTGAGKLTPAMAKTADTIMLLMRGAEGQVNLSEAAGGEQVDLSADDNDPMVLFASLLKEIDQQVNLNEEGGEITDDNGRVVDESATKGSLDLSDRIKKRAEEKARTLGITDLSEVYGDAAREISAEAGNKDPRLLAAGARR